MNFSLLVTLVFLTLIFIEMSLNKYNVSQKYRLYVFLLTIVLLISYEVYANPKTIKEFFIEITDIQDIPSLSEKNVTEIYKKGESLKLEDIKNPSIPSTQLGSPDTYKVPFSFSHPYQMIIITRNDDPEASENTDYYVFSNKLNTDSRIYSKKNSNADETKYNYIRKREEQSKNNKYGASAIYYRKKNFNLKNADLKSISCAKSESCKDSLSDADPKKTINYNKDKSFLTCESGTCQLYDEYILLAGGHGDDSVPFSNTVDILHLNLNDWESVVFKSLEYKTYVSGIRYKDKIYFIGGLLKTLSYSKKIEVFDLNTQQFDETIEMSEGYSNVKLTLFDNNIIIYGGFGELGYQSDIIIFNPTNKSFKNIILPTDLINTFNIRIAGFENHFVILEGIKNKSIEFNNKLVYYFSENALFKKININNIEKSINFFNMDSFINNDINNKLKEIDNNSDNNLVISISFTLYDLKEGWIFGKDTSLFGLCFKSGNLFYKINNNVKRIDVSLEKDNYYNLILSNTECIINYDLKNPLNYVDFSDNINEDNLDIELLNLEIYNNNLSKIELHDLYRKNFSTKEKKTENSAFLGKYIPGQTDITINPVDNFEYKMGNLVHNQKKDTAIFKFYNIVTKKNQTLEYKNINKNVNLNKFKDIDASANINPLISFTNYNVGLNFEDNIYFSSLFLDSNSLSTKLEKISLKSNTNNVLERSEITKTKNIVLGSDDKSFYNGSIIGLTIIRNDNPGINYNFANIDNLKYDKNKNIQIILDDRKKIKAILNNIDITSTTNTDLSNKKSIVFNGIDSSVVLPNINSEIFDIYFWFKTPIITNQPLVVSPDGKWSIKIIDRMVYYVDQNKDKLLSNNIILSNEIYFVSAKIDSSKKETQILVSEEIQRSVSLVDKNVTKCKLGQEVLETTKECIDCGEDEMGIKLNILQYEKTTGKKFDKVNDSDDLLLRCQACPEGTYTFGKTGQTSCRNYNYYKTKEFTLDQTNDKYVTLLDSIGKNTDILKSLDFYDKKMKNLHYEFK